MKNRHEVRDCPLRACWFFVLWGSVCLQHGTDFLLGQGIHQDMPGIKTVHLMGCQTGEEFCIGQLAQQTLLRLQCQHCSKGQTLHLFPGCGVDSAHGDIGLQGVDAGAIVQQQIFADDVFA